VYFYSFFWERKTKTHSINTPVTGGKILFAFNPNTHFTYTQTYTHTHTHVERLVVKIPGGKATMCWRPRFSPFESKKVPQKWRLLLLISHDEMKSGHPKKRRSKKRVCCCRYECVSVSGDRINGNFRIITVLKQ